ncbi:GNAT family N-acetyltransferase [Nocardia sp. NPDC058666]|uniref:GNAT family N-acetyltransferase n=1 Tax=unclassified Nocardia TaxID=2637762 RepID=UPI0036481CC4
MDISNGLTEPLFRSAVFDDLPAIAELESREFSPLAYPYFVLRQLFYSHGALWVVADLAGAVGGYVLVAAGQVQDAWLIGLAVSSSHQGRGLGRSLIERAVTRCRAADLNTLLTVRPSNASATNLYKTSGFREVGDEEKYFGVDEPRELLVRRLAPLPVLQASPRWQKTEYLLPGD